MRRLPVFALAAALAFGAACGGGGSDLEGSHVVADEIGDAAAALNARGERPAKALESADIAGVRFDSDGKSLRVRIALAASPMKDLPKDQKMGPSWFLQLWETEKKQGPPTYFIVVARDGAAAERNGRITGWRLSICPGTQVCTEPAKEAKLAIVEKEVRLDIPLTEIPDVEERFSWAALSYWNDSLDAVRAWSDWVPNVARPEPNQTTYPEPDKRGVFPPPAK